MKEAKSPTKTTSQKGTKKKEHAKAKGATIGKIRRTDSSSPRKVPKAMPKSKFNKVKETKSSTKSTDVKKKEKLKASGWY